MYARLFEMVKAPVKIVIDPYMDDWDYEDVLRQVAMLEVEGKTWHVDAEDLGWRNLSGEKEFTCTGAQQFLREISGYDDAVTIQLYAKRRVPATLTAYIYNHDSPTGELREIRRVK